MFGRGRRKSSGNIRTMQLFHEIKQQFPTLSDQFVSACIADQLHQANASHMGLSPENSTEPANPSQSGDSTSESSNPQSPIDEAKPRHRSKHFKLGKLLKKGHRRSGGSTPETPEATSPSSSSRSDGQYHQQHRRRSSKSASSSSTKEVGYVGEPRGKFYRLPKSPVSPDERSDMNLDLSDLNRNVLAKYSKQSDCVSVSVSGGHLPESVAGNSCFFQKRPTHLDIKSDFCASDSIPKSERCSDVHKLLNSENIANKPPRSPLREKRFTGEFAV